MATQHVPTLGRPPQAHRRLDAALAVITLTLLFVAGVTIWGTGREEEQPAPLEPDTPVAVTAAAGDTTTGARSHTVVLVATAGEAGEVAALMAALDDERRYGQVTMLVVDSDDQARQLRSLIGDLNRQRDVEGLAPIEVVDQRPRSSAGGAAAGSSAADIPHFTP
jgi:hypothetical protein